MNATHNNERLNDLLETLDDLHSATSDGDAHAFSGMTHTELMSYLREVIYTAQETMREAQQQRKKHTPIVRLTNKIEKVG